MVWSLRSLIPIKKNVVGLGHTSKLAFEKSQKTSIFELQDWKDLNLFCYAIVENLNSIWIVTPANFGGDGGGNLMIFLIKISL